MTEEEITGTGTEQDLTDSANFMKLLTNNDYDKFKKISNYLNDRDINIYEFAEEILKIILEKIEKDASGRT